LITCADDTPDDDSDPKPGEVIGGSTGTIAQLTESTEYNSGGSRGGKPRAGKKKRRRPIGFQLGELGHLDEPVEEGD
jgi:hypothetical protein